MNGNCKTGNSIIRISYESCTLGYYWRIKLMDYGVVFFLISFVPYGINVDVFMFNFI